MRLAEITRDETPCRVSLMPRAEADFNAACKEIESGDWDEAYAMFDMLARDTIPSALADAARIASNILDPANSPGEKAKRIAQFLPGRFFRVYDDENGWDEEAMRELADAQRRFSESGREPHSETASGPCIIL